MTIARNILLVLHIIGFLGILGTLLSQIPKPQKRILGGAMHLSEFAPPYILQIQQCGMNQII